jgi:hypothetical protein
VRVISSTISAREGDEYIEAGGVMPGLPQTREIEMPSFFWGHEGVCMPDTDTLSAFVCDSVRAGACGGVGYVRGTDRSASRLC